MSVIGFLSLGIYLTALTYVTIFGVSQFGILYNYLRFNRKQKQLKAIPARAKARALAAMAADGDQSSSLLPMAPGGNAYGNGMGEDEELPFVTIQLPLYNERYVVERLIDNVTQFDYPRDRFEIHVLDDSTDETQDLVRERVNYYKALGFNIEQIRRQRGIHRYFRCRLPSAP
jgi:cellulose synthase/poly-beta-1,6-N-acetylglucosamine synthase-like glycosyltransferase